jgi:structure-specific recognition protein 1
LAFNVQNRPAFEIPYSEISNTNLAGKNEVAVEFSLPAGGAETGTNGHLGGARSRGRKAGAAKDQLVEMRFYIPGTATRKEKDEDGQDKSVDGSDAEEQNAANLFYEMLMDKAEIGEVAGDTYATFLDVLHLTPRLVGEDLSHINSYSFAVEDVSISTCTRAHSDYVVRRTTTRFSMIISRNS